MGGGVALKSGWGVGGTVCYYLREMNNTLDQMFNMQNEFNMSNWTNLETALELGLAVATHLGLNDEAAVLLTTTP